MWSSLSLNSVVDSINRLKDEVELQMDVRIIIILILMPGLEVQSNAFPWYYITIPMTPSCFHLTQNRKPLHLYLHHLMPTKKMVLNLLLQVPKPKIMSLLLPHLPSRRRFPIQNREMDILHPPPIIESYAMTNLFLTTSNWKLQLRILAVGICVVIVCACLAIRLKIEG